jgi:predicted ferric reductase
MNDSSTAGETRAKTKMKTSESFYFATAASINRTRLIREVLSSNRLNEGNFGVAEKSVQRRIQKMYQHRKLVFFGVSHAVITLVVWAHFFLQKYRIQEHIPIQANLYWWKRLTPPFEFGAMHAILFQMALLPLTMSRATVAKLSTTKFGKFVPLDKIVGMHIHLGYCMCSFVFASTILFFVFFGQACADQHKGREPTPGGKKTFCIKMKSEIMLTGYGIMALLLIVAITSFLRNRIKYETFYIVHHLVFTMFALAIAHTMDDAFRRGQVRSQNFKWFTASLVLYLTDRINSLFNAHACKVAEITSFGDVDSASRKVVHLKISRPVAFTFRPGQYVYLRINAIDPHWHPFSIASSPNEDTLDFFIEVMSKSRTDQNNSWTQQLWALQREKGVQKIETNIVVDINGAYGTGFNEAEDYMQICAIGSGTGIVPMLSLAKSKIDLLVNNLNPNSHQKSLAQIDEISRDYASVYEKKKSVFDLLSNLAYNKERFESSRFKAKHGTAPVSIKDIKDTAIGALFKSKIYDFRLKQIRKNNNNASSTNATQKFYQNQSLKNMWQTSAQVVMLFPLFVEVISLSLLISFSVNRSETTDAMHSLLIWLFVGNTCVYTLYWMTRKIAVGTWILDLLVNVVSWIACGFWIHIINDERSRWNVYQIYCFSALSLYRIYNGLDVIVSSGTPQSRACQNHLASTKATHIKTIEKLTLVFISPQADLIEYVWADLTREYERLLEVYGTRADSVFDIQVYCTAKSVKEQNELSNTIRNTLLAKRAKPVLFFRRPDLNAIAIAPAFDQVIKDELTGGGLPTFSASLIAFCGSTQLGSQIFQAVMLANSRLKAISPNHTLDFFQENYGQTTPAKQRGDASALKEVEVKK